MLPTTDSLPEPRQNRSKETVDTILETAARLFEERGVAYVTTNDIAASAHIAVGSVYRYFPDKNAILEALIGRYVEKIEAIFASIGSNPHLSEMSWQEVIYLLLEKWSACLNESQASIYSRFYRNSPPFSETSHRLRQEFWGKFSRIIHIKQPALYTESQLQGIAAICVVSIIATLDAMQDMARRNDETRRIGLLHECSVMISTYIERGFSAHEIKK